MVDDSISITFLSGLSVAASALVPQHMRACLQAITFPLAESRLCGMPEIKFSCRLTVGP